MLTIKDLPVYIATHPIDFRKSIDSLCMIVANMWQQDPQKGLYVFYNKHHDKLKILFWNVNGFVLTYKRLEKGRFFTQITSDTKSIIISEQQMQWLVGGLDWQLMSEYKPLTFQQYA
jgi:transposase